MTLSCCFYYANHIVHPPPVSAAKTFPDWQQIQTALHTKFISKFLLRKILAYPKIKPLNTDWECSNPVAQQQQGRQKEALCTAGKPDRLGQQICNRGVALQAWGCRNSAKRHWRMLTSKNTPSTSILDAKQQHMRKDQRSWQGRKTLQRLGRCAEREKEHGSRTHESQATEKWLIY